MPAVSTEMRDTILARQREGANISLIAKELGVSRPTVYKALSIVDNWEAWVKDKSSNITRLAYNCVERGLERGDSKLGMEWLKCTVFSPEHGTTYNISADNVLMSGVDLMPRPTGPAVAQLPTPGPSAPIIDAGVTVSNGVTIDNSIVPSAAATCTEAGANPTPADIRLPSHTNFSISALSTDELIAELRNRGVHCEHTRSAANARRSAAGRSKRRK